jgi:hypothetical protein
MRQEQNYSLLMCCFAISPCCFTTTQSSTLTGHITTQTYVGIQPSLMMKFRFNEFLHTGNVICLVSRLLHFLVAMALLGHGKFTNQISETNMDGPLRRTENTTVTHHAIHGDVRIPYRPMESPNRKSPLETWQTVTFKQHLRFPKPQHRYQHQCQSLILSQDTLSTNILLLLLLLFTAIEFSLGGSGPHTSNK